MNKHTPRSWSTNGAFVWSTSDKAKIKERGEDCSIEVFGDTWEEQKANAHLIAAAPELLEVLKWTLARVEKLAPHKASEGDAALYGIAAARGAIAKATGGEA